MHQVFLSYSRVDGDFAELVRVRLNAAECRCWFDRVEIEGGEAWCQEIDDGIRGAVVVVLILTPAARASEFVSYEWAFALGAGVTVVPVMLQPTPLPPRLATLHFLDFTRREARSWDELINRIRSLISARQNQVVRVSSNAPAMVKDAAADLDGADLEIARRAVARLARIELPEAEAVLVEALRHPVVEVRVAAAEEMARRGDVRAVPGLLEGNRFMGWHMELSRRIKPIGVAAIPELRRALKDPVAWLRRDVVWALAAIGDESVVSDLADRMEDADAEVRRVAFRALHQWSTPAARRAIADGWRVVLRDLQASDDRVRQQTRQMLEGLETPEALAALASPDAAEGDGSSVARRRAEGEGETR